MAAVSSIHHLALFICHLFIDGHFRTAHFVYKPNTFEFNWLLKIDAICPEPIPLYLTDITLPWVWPWNEKDTQGNVLQLCFFDPKQLLQDINELKSKGFAYNRVYLFNSTDVIDTKEQDSTFKTLRRKGDSNNLIVRYNPKNVSVYPNNEDSFERMKPILTVNHETNFDHIDVFDRSFGEFERTTRSLAIKHSSIPDLHGSDRSNLDTFLTRFYHLQMNSSYIELSLINKTYSYVDSIQVCTINPQKYYKEFSTENVCTEKQNTFPNDHTVYLYVDEGLAPTKKQKYNVSLYSYKTTELRGLLVYGTDFQREISFLRAPESAKLVATLIALFLVLATIILYISRRRLHLPGDTLGASFFDCLIPFIGGGNLRMKHRFERWFFGIMLVGAFFTMSVFGGDLVDSVVRTINSKIRTFEELGERHPHIKVFSISTFMSNKPQILGMLRAKMGVNVEDVDMFSYFFKTNHSTLTIFGPEFIDYSVVICEKLKLDYDILEEPLGEIVGQYFLASENVIPQRMIDKIGQLTVPMAEHGFYKFYESFAEYNRRSYMNEYHHQFFEKEGDDLQTITIEQLWPVIVIILSLNGVAMIIFVAEIFYYKWRNWRNCRVQILPFVERQLQPQPRSRAIDSHATKRGHTAPLRKKSRKRKNGRKCRSARF